MESEIIIERNVDVVMRDGTKLGADIYRPQTEKPLPVLLMRTPYEKEDAQSMNYAHPSYYARKGYIVIIQDTRGRWKSAGEFYPFRHEREDGYDTIEWAGSLPYSNGRVGMYGFSYAGAVQLQAAIARPPHLVTIIPAMTGSDLFQGFIYENGVFSLALIQSWLLFLGQGSGGSSQEQQLVNRMSRIQETYNRLPLSSAFPVADYPWAGFYQDWLSHPARDDYWKKFSIKDYYDRISIPILHVGGLFDAFVNGTIENYTSLNKTSGTQQALLLTPWYHMPWSRYVGECDFGEQADNRIDEWQLEWFDYWLKRENDQPDQALRIPRVRYFVTGENKWKQAAAWPPADQRKQKWYLFSEEKANSISGDGKLLPSLEVRQPKDVFVYNPHIPVPANGGHSAAVPELTPMGPKNQLWMEVRNDVLIYSSDRLASDLQVAGDVRFCLHVSTDAEDTDFAVKILDVFPDGRAFNLSEGIARTSFRRSLADPVPVKPHEIVELQFRAHALSHVFKKGHSIRLEISSSMFPTYARHSNRFKRDKEEGGFDFVTAMQSVYHSKEHPSYLEWDVISKD